jgi:16S rRNA (cytosine967-C5)-methyltransferase
LAQDLHDALAVQDEGSQLVARFAGATPDERVLDVCAAPGGKTLILAGDLALGDPRHHSVLVAGDRRLARVRLLSATLGRSGLDIPVVALDALRPLPFGSPFDCVFLDAPCSGLGTLRRDPDLKWSRREDDLGRLVADQLRMLQSAADLVRPGGRLIYATCSSEPEENTGVVGTFLERDARFAVARPPESVRVPTDVIDSSGRLVTEPFRHGLDAYFAVRLVRREGT